MIKKALIFLLFFLPGFLSFGQREDFGLWTEISLEKKINPRWEVSITESIRLNENVTAINQHYSHLSATYKITRNFSLSAAYRNSQKFNFDETIDLRHRGQLEAIYEFNLEKLGFELQERFQFRYDNIQREAGWENPEIYFRTRLTIDYDLDRKIKPFTSFEVFLNEDRYIDNLRGRLGFDYAFDKRNSLKLFYMLDFDVQVNDPLHFYALGLGYKFSF